MWNWKIFATLLLLAGIPNVTAFPSTTAGGWDSVEVTDSPHCVFHRHQLRNLLRLTRSANQNLQNPTVGIQAAHSRLPPSDRCNRYLYDIEQELMKTVREALLIKVNGVRTTVAAEKLKIVQENFAKLDRKMHRLISEHGLELAAVRSQYNTQLHILERRVAQLMKELDVQVQLVYAKTVENVVLKLKHLTVDDAVTEMDYFIRENPTIAEDIVKTVVKQMWTSGRMYFPKILEFIDKLPSHVRLWGYSQLTEYMKSWPVLDCDLDQFVRAVIMGVALKVREATAGDQTILGNSVLDKFPEGIKRLMRLNSCLLMEWDDYHYLSVVSENGTDRLHGSTSPTGVNNLWSIVPFQDTSDSPVLFHIVNTGVPKYLFEDEDLELELTTLSGASIWNIKLEESRFLLFESSYYHIIATC